MTIYEKSITEFRLEILARWAMALVVLAIIVYFVIVLPARSETPYRCWSWLEKVLIQLVPAVFFLIPLVFFSWLAVDATYCLSKWERGNYLTVEGQICDLSVQVVERDGTDGVSYDCTFCVGDVSFSPEVRLSPKDKESINKVFEDQATVRVYYVLNTDASPWALKIEQLSTPE